MFYVIQQLLSIFRGFQLFQRFTSALAACFASLLHELKEYCTDTIKY